MLVKKIKDFIEKPAGPISPEKRYYLYWKKRWRIFDSPIYVVLITSIKQEMRKQIKR
jgi:hypothetical protein